MSIEVNGDNNRVAGRDYYECKIRPCPRCEQRFIEQHKKICRHCWDKKQLEKAKSKAAAFGLVVLFCWGVILQWRDKHGLETEPAAFLNSLTLAVVLVGVAYVLIKLVLLWMEHRS